MVDSTKHAWLPPIERILRHTVPALMAVFATCLAEAQQPGRTNVSVIRRSWPYLAVGMGSSPCSGGSSPHLHGAIGAEKLVIGGFGFGAEIGADSDSDFSFCASGVASANMLYHFGRHSAPGWSPFVTGGGSLLVTEGGGGGGNVGVCIVRFTGRRLGLRLEGRAHWFPNSNGFTEVRLGVSF